MTDLKQKAIEKGLCVPFQKEWNENNLVGMYKQGVTWCMSNKYPTLEDMLPYDEMLVENEIYNDKHPADLLLTSLLYIFNQCTGRVEIKDYNVSNVYVALDSILEVSVKDRAILTIECYDNTILRLSVAKNAKCVVWAYGNSVVQVLSGNAKITRK